MLKAYFPSLQIKMPMDYTTYLLSSSPTASSLEILSNAFSKSEVVRPVFNFNETSKEIENIRNEENTRENLLKPIVSRRSSTDDDSGVSEPSSGRVSPSTPTSASPKLKKKVSFADHKGLALATVKVMTEPSDVPPKLKPEILLSITQGATAGVTSQPPLVLNFKQPASDYLSFREQLDRNLVSLENVIIRDYSVLGTIKVKNIFFEKKVFLRCTFDSWETHVDFESQYVDGQSHSAEVYDTFSFEFTVPPNFDCTKSMEFAVCYIADGKEYWDNNGGKNYEILSANFKSSQPEQPHSSPLTDFASLRNVSSWTDFASWNKVDTSLPYW